MFRSLFCRCNLFAQSSLAITVALLGALTSTATAPESQGKRREVWRFRYDLDGMPVEIYDVYQGETFVGSGLRRIVERANYYNPERHKKYQELVKPEWEKLFVVKGKYLFGRKKGEWDKPLYLLDHSRTKDSLKFSAPVQTPYVQIMGAYLSYELGGMTIETLNRMNSSGPLFGIRSSVNTERYPSDQAIKELQIPYQSGFVHNLDFLDDELAPLFTLYNVRNFPRRYGKVWRVDYDTTSPSPITVFLNDNGEPVSPEIPLIKAFNGDDNPTLAIPTSLEFKRFVPILSDGTMKVEPVPTAGYYPSGALYEDESRFVGIVRCWTKEYLTPDGPRFGWASLDLKHESGPIWRSIKWFTHGLNQLSPNSQEIVAQLNDGTWTVYHAVTDSVDTELPHRPWVPGTYPTRQAAISAFAKVYAKEVAEPALAEAKRQWEAQKKAYEEQGKWLGIDDSMNSAGMDRATLQSLLYQTVTSLNAGLDSDFNQVRQRLPGDYYLKYLAVAYHMRLVFLTESQALESAQRAQNALVKSTFEGIAKQLVQQLKEDQARAEALKKAREAERNNPNRYRPVPTGSGGGFTSPFRDPYAGPSYAERSRAHEQYMGEMWKYLGGQQSWRPYGK